MNDHLIEPLDDLEAEVAAQMGGAPLPTFDESDVNVDWLPASPAPSYVPQRMIDYFASNGLRLSWTPNNPTNLGLLKPHAQPVMAKHIPEEMQEELRDTYELTDSGYIQRGDSILVMKSQALWERQQAAYAAAQRSREGDYREEVERFNELLESMRARGASIRPVSGNARSLAEEREFTVPLDGNLSTNELIRRLGGEG